MAKMIALVFRKNSDLFGVLGKSPYASTGVAQRPGGCLCSRISHLYRGLLVNPKLVGTKTDSYSWTIAGWMDVVNLSLLLSHHR